jgi:hypothetical protein
LRASAFRRNDLDDVARERSRTVGEEIRRVVESAFALLREDSRDRSDPRVDATISHPCRNGARQEVPAVARSFQRCRLDNAASVRRSNAGGRFPVEHSFLRYGYEIDNGLRESIELA